MAGEAAGARGAVGRYTGAQPQVSWGRLPEIYPEDVWNVRLFNRKMKMEEGKLKVKIKQGNSRIVPLLFHNNSYIKAY